MSTGSVSSVTHSCPTLCDPMDCSTHQASLSITNSQSLLKLMSIESVMPVNHLILCRPFLLLPSIFPSIRVFCKELLFCIRQPKYWSFSFSISPSNEYSGLISFRIEWFDLLAVQGTQEFSPIPQFKSISSLALSFLYSSTLTSIHEYWKNHSFDQMELCWKSNVSVFLICCLGWSYLFLQGARGQQVIKQQPKLLYLSHLYPDWNMTGLSWSTQIIGIVAKFLHEQSITTSQYHQAIRDHITPSKDKMQLNFRY